MRLNEVTHERNWFCLFMVLCYQCKISVRIPLIGWGLVNVVHTIVYSVIIMTMMDSCLFPTVVRMFILHINWALLKDLQIQNTDLVSAVTQCRAVAAGVLCQFRFNFAQLSPSTISMYSLPTLQKQCLEKAH